MEKSGALPYWALLLEPEQTVLSLGKGKEGAVSSLVFGIGYQSIAEHIFKHHMPKPLEVEEAIMRIEDEIMRVQRHGMIALPLLSADKHVWAIAERVGFNVDDALATNQVLTREAVEFLFNRWADIVSGSPVHASEQVVGKELAAQLLILRELLHHLNFNVLQLMRVLP